jgi:iron complex transport system ATP-binding protein
MCSDSLDLLLTDIRFRYPESDWELRVPDFRLSEGLLLGIIGPNGSGKSTLLRLAAGIGKSLTGRVSLGGQDLARLPRREIARLLGYLPQEIASSYDYTVEEIVRMGRYPHLTGLGGLGSEDRAVVRESLLLTDLLKLRARPLSRLSGGEKKRAFLASVLAQKPRLLLLDEPTGALDIHRGVQFFKILRRLSRDGMGIAVVTHDLNFASLFCQRIFLMSEGKSMAQGDPEAVLTGPNMRAVYGSDILIERHPDTGRPVLLPSDKEGESR